MKITNTQLLLCFIACCSLFTLSNCNGDCGPTPKILIKDLGRYVAYTGNDTLRFLRNNLYAQTFVGQGLERFYVTDEPREDDDCPEDYESVRIRFVNPQTKDEIKMEYSFKPGKDVLTLSFGFNQNSFNNYVIGGTKSSELLVNNKLYSYVSYHSNSIDTNEFIAYCYPRENDNQGVIKIKTNGNVLTLLR